MAAPNPIPGSVLSGKGAPSILPGGGELRGLGALGLDLRLNFAALGAPVPRIAPPGASAACYISPRLAAQRSSNSKLIEGVQKFTSLIAANCGARVKLLHDTAWAGHDFVVFYRDLKDPEVSQGERLVSLGEFGSSMAGVLAGVFHTQWLDQASSTLNFVASIGDHLHTGRLIFSQSEILQFSSVPGAEEYANIVGLAELVLPSA